MKIEADPSSYLTACYSIIYMLVYAKPLLISYWSQTTIGATKQWIVTPAEKTKFDAMFAQADTNADGLVSGNL